MSSQTFKAQMAVGSWMGTPLMPDVIEPTTVIEAKMKGKAATKQIESIVINNDSS